jgi:hypothetical protein
MSEARITGLAEGPDEGAVGSIQSFRSNVLNDHFVVSLSDGLPKEDDWNGDPMAYVDLRSAIDMAFHFVGVANALGARLQVLDEVQVLDARVAAFEHGYRVGRDGEERQSLRHLDNIAAKLRELADELS